MTFPMLNSRPWVIAAFAALASLTGCGTDQVPQAVPARSPKGVSMPATAPAAQETLKTLFGFKDPSAVEGWQVINDGVVGGKSQGAIRPSASGTAVFEGTISQEHGGFVTVRCPNGAYDLRGFAGLEVRLRGDGKRYHLLVKTNPQDNGFQYLADLWTHEGTWQTLRVPFADFKGDWLGTNLTGGKGIDPAKVVSMGFVVANYQQGPFRLEVVSIKAYP
jgi:monofunctional biosynthetic peptidoglycan transglycosylase